MGLEKPVISGGCGLVHGTFTGDGTNTVALPDLKGKSNFIICAYGTNQTGSKVIDNVQIIDGVKSLVFYSGGIVSYTGYVSLNDGVITTEMGIFGTITYYYFAW